MSQDNTSRLIAQAWVLGMVDDMLEDEIANDLPGETRRQLIASGYGPKEASDLVRNAKTARKRKLQVMASMLGVACG